MIFSYVSFTKSKELKVANPFATTDLSNQPFEWTKNSKSSSTNGKKKENPKLLLKISSKSNFHSLLTDNPSHLSLPIFWILSFDSSYPWPSHSYIYIYATQADVIQSFDRFLYFRRRSDEPETGMSGGQQPVHGAIKLRGDQVSLLFSSCCLT